MKYWVRHPSLKMVLAVALALASAGAAALGLGQIEVKSRIGQPLLAEIAIISSDPAELEELRAGLASPETFARIGLQPPQGIVADLQFTPALDTAGRPVIRVTSAQPVTEPLLTFLVQVDWGQGRLVREYSVLVDTPRTVSAPVQPPIQAPVVAEPNVIERPLEPATAVAATPAADAVPGAARAAEPVRPTSAIAAATPRAMPTDPVAEAAQSSAAANEYGPVKAGESLSQIAVRLDIASGLSLDQSMIALLRANPDAFIAGNINQLKQGAVLRVPPSSETADIDARQAMELVQGQARQWRQARRVSQPPTAESASAPAASPPPTAPVARGKASARLEIVPPGASQAMRAGTQSGIDAGGEGQMLRQQLQQTRESLAARDAELRELKSRVADLEKLQGDQQQLLVLKDSELAAAQQRLAESSKPPPSPSAQAQGQTAATTTATAPAEAQGSSLPWVLGGFGLLTLVLLAGWWLGRRSASAPAPRFRAPPTIVTSSLADAFAPAPSAPVAPTVQVARLAPDQAPVTAVVDTTSQPPSALSVQQTDGSNGPVELTTQAPEELAALWDRRDRRPLPSGSSQAPAPAWHAGAAKPKVSEASAALSTAETSAGDRLELAQAYLDLGDRDSARQLLGEVVSGSDHAARQQASRMLRELE